MCAKKRDLTSETVSSCHRVLMPVGCLGGGSPWLNMLKCPSTYIALMGRLRPAELSFTPSTRLTHTFPLVPKVEDLGSRVSFRIGMNS